MIHYLKKYVIL